MAIRRDPIDQTLARHGVSSEALAAAQTVASKQKVSLPRAMSGVSGVDHRAVAQALSDLSGLPVLEAIELDHIEADTVRRFPLTTARERRVLPLYVSEGQMVVGLADLSGVSVLDELRVLLGRPVRPVLVPADVLEATMLGAYDKASASADSVLEDVDHQAGEGGDLVLDDADLLDDPNEAPIIRFVNALLTQAIKERASDIHIEPFEKELEVRFRVDGVLYKAVNPPYRFKSSIVSRIKIMSGLNIAEKRLPQDGRIRRRMGGREIDLRVSTVPVRHGERVVMRILEKGSVFSLDRIGMARTTLDPFRGLIRKPHGILLVSGPTGSGKSTTLYSAISEINQPDKNILTIEDPVEYELKGIGQVQVNHKIELTFAAALRSFLRQDPDIILVGEIRDRETAGKAVEASLTGHLVFSTVHTNDAAGAFTRLTEMGIEPFLVADTLLGVLAQRLVRRLCVHCKEPYTPSDDELAELQLTRAQVAGGTPYRAVGCEECNHHGYQGRLGIFELLIATDRIKAAILAHADAGSIKRAAVKDGLRTLRDDGIRVALEGTTTFDEVLRVTREDSVES